MSKGHRPRLPEEAVENARQFAQWIVDRDFKGNRTHAATALGLNQSGFTAFLNERTGAGLKILESLADYESVTIDIVLGRETPWMTDLFAALHEVETSGVPCPFCKVKSYLPKHGSTPSRVDHDDWCPADVALRKAGIR